jgi:acetate kinase
VENISNILAVNGGSSSIRIALFSDKSSAGSLTRIFEVSLINIEQADTSIIVSRPQSHDQPRPVHGTDKNSAISSFLDVVEELASDYPLGAIGNRFVRGGQNYYSSQPITPELEQDLRDIASLDPEHIPMTLSLISELGKRFPVIQQYAVFDSAFFHSLPRVAQIIALPRRFREAGLRRYGFHGLSYSYLLSKLREVDESGANGRLIFAHLGSGASLAAISQGQPIDTTMGFTPASGILMSTRSGDLDPGIISFLNQSYGTTIEEFDHMINFESGLMGVSAISSDMKTLLDQETDNDQAAEAIELFCYQIRKAVGALSATLGGVDKLVFTGGIGEQSAIIRSRVCAGLEYLGIMIDEASNAKYLDVISTSASPVEIRIIATDENLTIAREVQQLINHR